MRTPFTQKSLIASKAVKKPHGSSQVKTDNGQIREIGPDKKYRRSGKKMKEIYQEPSLKLE